MHQSVGMNFCDELRAACKGIASVGEIRRSQFLLLFKTCDAFAENSVGSSAPFVPPRDQIVLRTMRETI
jgi:hypothetical protein